MKSPCSARRPRHRRGPAIWHPRFQPVGESLEHRWVLDSVVVFNEVMYHPADTDTRGEWIELRNLLSVDMDLSGWSLRGGADYVFPEGTKVPADGYLLLAADTAAWAGSPVANLRGPFTGTLDNAGEEIRLYNNSDRLMDVLRYGDSGEWPSAADGAGPSLAKRDPYWTSGDPSNWVASAGLRGTPGVDNWPTFDSMPQTTKVFTLPTSWRYLDSGADPGASWRQADYVDTAWNSGQASFYAGISVAQGDQLRIQPLDPAGDGDIGSGRTYTHTYDFGNADAGATIQGTKFTQMTTATLASTPGFAWQNSTGIRTQGKPTAVAPLDGPLRELMQDYVANTVNAAEGTVQVTLTNLVPGTRYLTRLLSRRADAGTRPVTLQFDPGNGQPRSLRLDQNNPSINDPNSPYAVEYEFTATTDRLVISGTQHEASRPWLWYGLVNEVVQLTGNTQLQSNKGTAYFRKSFSYNGDPTANHTLQLRLLVDDGAVVYLNGQELYRSNMPAGPITHTTSAVQDVATSQFQLPVSLPGDALRMDGPNVLAIGVHQAAGGDPDVRFGAELTIVETPRVPGDTPRILLNEIAASADPQPWVELINRDANPVNLKDLLLEQHGQAIERIALPDRTLAPQETIVIAKPANLLNWLTVDQLVLFDSQRTTVVDAQPVRLRPQAREWARQMDGVWQTPSVVTPGSDNRFDTIDSVVINEIMYHAAAQYRTATLEFQESPEEWIELFNRGTAAVDLSGWSLGGGIDFDFPAGTQLAPGAYLVVANNAQLLQAKWPSATVIGNFSRSLADGGDLIQLHNGLGNVADEVRYYDGVTWPGYADGGGSSLELRDPWADNNRADSWAASTEADTQDAPWVRISYEGLGATSLNAQEPRDWHELIFGLLDAGEVLIDDVSVIESPAGAAIERMQNGGFERGAEKWRFLGNHGLHGRTRVVVDPDNPANHVLHLVATGATEHMSNHIETTFADGAKILASNTYRISFRARWLAGSPQIHTRLYFNRLPGLHILPQPYRTGTPGQPNSQRVANLGPSFSDLDQWPAVPGAGQPVTITVRAQDAQGIAGMKLFYAEDGKAFQSLPMQGQAEGYYSAQIPGMPASRIMQYYVEGTDSQGTVSFYPAEGPGSRALYRVKENNATVGVRHNLRILATTADLNTMFTNVNFTSNERIGATVIWRDSQIYHNVELRFKGSGFSRGSAATGFNLRFAPDQKLFGEHESAAIDRQGGPWGLGASHRELIVKHIANSAGDVPMMYDDVVELTGPRDSLNGSAQFMVARYDDVFTDSQFENGSEGTRYKYELIYYSTVTVGGSPEGLKLPPSTSKPGVFPVIGVDIPYMGPDPNAYRWNYLIRNQRAKDDYSSIIALSDVLRLAGTTVGGELDIKSQAVMDVDAWMRTFAFESLTGLNDTFNQGLPHNLMLYVRPSDKRVLPLPWDMDHSLHQDTSMAIYGTGSRITRVINIPTNRRVFQQHLWDMLQTTYNLDYLTPWIRHYATRAQQDNSADILSYITRRRNFVISKLAAKIPFEISTPGKENLQVDTPQVTLEGKGWIDVREVRQAGRLESLPVRWLDAERWQVTVPLRKGSQSIELQAYDLQGQQVGSASAQVTTTADSPLVTDLRITEIHYHPAAPNLSEQTAGWTDADDFEFLELTNRGKTTLDLAGVRLLDPLPDGTSSGVSFTFPNVQLQAGASVVVVENLDAFKARYGGTITPVGVYTGRLSNSGETLTLVDPLGDKIQQFAYDDAWYPETDGKGPSLEIRSATTTTAGQWDKSPSWVASRTAGGTPGRAVDFDLNADGALDAGDIDRLCAGLQAQDGRFDLDLNRQVDLEDVDLLVVSAMNSAFGDVDFDGVFGTSDMVLIFQRGQYEDTIPKNSKWLDGDWDCDGDFTTSDLVFAMQRSGWEQA